jgi:hypothetical protein
MPEAHVPKFHIGNNLIGDAQDDLMPPYVWRLIPCAI